MAAFRTGDKKAQPSEGPACVGRDAQGGSRTTLSPGMAYLSMSPSPLESYIINARKCFTDKIIKPT